MENRKKTNKKMIEPITETSADVPISITVDGVKYYYLYVDMDAEHSFEFRNSFRINGLGSVTELIDENENVVNVYRYTPFGESLYKEEGVFNPYQYTGRRYDEETGQYYYRARMYSPQQARFLSSDPLGMIDGPNMYAYCGNNPVNYRDPSGRMWFPYHTDPFWGQAAMINGHQLRYPQWRPRYSHAPGGLPEWVTCVLRKLGTSVISDPLCYWACGGALKNCGYLISPKLIALCVGVGCACAAGDLIMAIGDCR